MDTLFAICPTYAVEDGQATGFMLMRREPDGSAEPWPILVTRKGNNFAGFENACPHQGARLDTVPGEFIDEDAISSPAEIITPSSTSTPAIALSAPVRGRR